MGAIKSHKEGEHIAQNIRDGRGVWRERGEL
jgi:hypothetical protein